MRIYNTMSRKVEEFAPINGGKVGMYNCGPTVYDSLTIGNWRAYVFVDTLKRALLYLGFEVNQVMNVTDVGHLTSDEDYGDDKLEKGAKRENKSVWDVAQFYLDDFIRGRDSLHILPPNVLCRATDHIPEQIDMIEKLVASGHAYVTKEAVYFDVTTFSDYSKLSGQKLEDKEIAVREELITDKNKRHPQDFRLWQLDRPDHQMLWDSPWGRGFPGWHIECSAMSVHYLGQPFDIHTGGVDHIPVHHTNEIAQAESANGIKFVNYWMHNEFLTIDGGRMGKSLGNGYTLQDIEKFLSDHFGFSSRNGLLALRYLYLTAHYRKKLDFTKESLYAAFLGLFELYKQVALIYQQMNRSEQEEIASMINQKTNSGVVHFPDIALSASAGRYTQKLIENAENDLDTPSIIATLYILLSDDGLTNREKVLLAVQYDQLLGLGIFDVVKGYISNFPPEVQTLIDERGRAREEKNYGESDKLRGELEKIGVEVLDEKDSSHYYRK